MAERVKAGMAAAKARGKPFGRPAPSAHVVARIEERAYTTSTVGKTYGEGIGIMGLAF